MATSTRSPAASPGPSKPSMCRTISRSKPASFSSSSIPSDYEVALEQAKAALERVADSRSPWRGRMCRSPTFPRETTLVDVRHRYRPARAALAGAQRDYESAVADVRKSEADNVKAQADLARYKLAGRERRNQQTAIRSGGSGRQVRRGRRRREKSHGRGRRTQHRRDAGAAEQSQTKQVEARAQSSAADRHTECDRAEPPGQCDPAANDGGSGDTQSFLHENLRAGRRHHRQEERGARAAGCAGAATDGRRAAERYLDHGEFQRDAAEEMHPGQRATIHVDAYDAITKATSKAWPARRVRDSACCRRKMPRAIM